MIKNGYYIKSRSIQESNIYNANPCTRELWDLLLMIANYSDNICKGHTIKRGQTFRTYKELQDALSWQVGWRKMTYNENQMKRSMKFLRSTQMITTEKKLGGVLITICNYDYYQNPDSYERTTETTTERTNDELITNQPIPGNKEERKERKKKKKIKKRFENEKLEQTFNYFKEMRIKIKRPMTDRAETMLLNKLEKLSGGNDDLKIKILERSIINCWQDVFELKQNNNQQKGDSLWKI